VKKELFSLFQKQMFLGENVERWSDDRLATASVLAKRCFLFHPNTYQNTVSGKTGEKPPFQGHPNGP
jgi:hypothetical protein